MPAGRLSPARWAATQSATGLLVLRLLLVANALLLVAVGGLALTFVERPAGIVAAAVAWAFAAALAALMPYTDPHRGDSARW
jgi:hypothetical protein